MNRIVWVLVGWLAATGAWAAEVKLDDAAIAAVLTDKSLYADGDIEQMFQNGGLTTYMQRGSASQGRWKIENDAYCSQWPPSKSWVCYDVTRDGETITFIAADGTRYPMRGKK